MHILIFEKSDFSIISMMVTELFNKETKNNLNQELANKIDNVCTSDVI